MRARGPGPYWVIAVDPDYEWAIITGGPPTKQGSTPGTCTWPTRTGSLNGNGEGFWLFFRTPTPDAAALSNVRAVAASKGLDLSVLIDVPQSGCQYAPIPSNTSTGGRPFGGLFG